VATTTNFGWSTPDDTAYVKDGAAAIRTLGSAVDSSLVDLKGGTTGQVLSKATGTDMDFSWSTLNTDSYVQIASGTLSPSTTISGIPGTYKHLRLVLSDVTLTTSGNVLYRINGVTSSNYSWIGFGTGSASFAGASSAATETSTRGTIAASANHNKIVSEIPDYQNGNRQIISYVNRQSAGSPANHHSIVIGGMWQTVAVTDITIFSSTTIVSGNYVLFGVK
jgi:hypothetical protein